MVAVEALINLQLSTEFCTFILGDDTDCEVEGQDGGHKIRNMLIKRIDHLSDLVSRRFEFFSVLKLILIRQRFVLLVVIF